MLELANSNEMAVLVTYPGTFMHAQQAARAFAERNVLRAFVTGFAAPDQSAFANIIKHLPKELQLRIAKELSRRQISEIQASKIISRPGLDLLRSAIARYTTNPILADIVWDYMSHKFDRTVANRYLNGIQLVHAFEYTAQYTFERANEMGIACVLAMPSIDSREFEEIKRREQSKFPELRTRYDAYFDRQFEKRYERRRAEISRADIIVANSRLTKLSHIRAGADKEKIHDAEFLLEVRLQRDFH